MAIARAWRERELAVGGPLRIEHTLIGLADDDHIDALLRLAGTTADAVRNSAHAALVSYETPSTGGPLEIAVEVVDAFSFAARVALSCQEEVGADYLLLAVLRSQDGTVTRILNGIGVDSRQVLKILKAELWPKRSGDAAAETTGVLLHQAGPVSYSQQSVARFVEEALSGSSGDGVSAGSFPVRS